MAEEIHGANLVIPWCMLATTLLNGILGFGIVLAVLFVTVDITAVLKSPTGALGFPFMQIFYDATGSRSGASVMISIVIIMDICASIAFLATSSRIVFAFGRDHGLPFWRQMSKVTLSPYPPSPFHLTGIDTCYYSCKPDPPSQCMPSSSWPSSPA